MIRCPSQDWDNYMTAQEGPEECPNCGGPNHDEETGDPVCKEAPDFCCVACERKMETGAYSIVSFDDAKYVGDDEDGVYYQAAEGPDGWYVSTVVDCNTSGFCEGYITDDGPYPTEAEAVQAGHDSASEWCFDNKI
jgi:hypothetical protein